MRTIRILLILSILYLNPVNMLTAQEVSDSSVKHIKKTPNLDYIDRMDTMLHVQTWISKHQMNYRLVYSEDFKLVLAPNKMNSVSLGFTYRYLDLGVSFTPDFLNKAQKDAAKGQSSIFSFRTSFSMYRFNLGIE